MLRSFAFVALAFGIGFTVVWWARSSGAARNDGEPRSSAGARRAAARIDTPIHRSARADRKPAFVSEVREVVRPPTDLERLVMEGEAWATPLLRTALESKVALDDAADCFEAGDFAGKIVIELAWQVVSSADEARAFDLRFVAQRSGQPLPRDVSTCIEHQLAGTYTAYPELGPFPRFEGELPVVLTWVR